MSRIHRCGLTTCLQVYRQCEFENVELVDVNYAHCLTVNVAALALQALRLIALLAHTLASFQPPTQHFVICTVKFLIPMPRASSLMPSVVVENCRRHTCFDRSIQICMGTFKPLVGKITTRAKGKETM